MNLTGNKIIISGATRGIGLAILDKFYHLGNTIIAVARNAEGLEKLKLKYEKIIPLPADLGTDESIENLIREIKEKHADANTLINNAGIQINFYEKRFGEDPEKLASLKDEIQINFSAPVILTYKLIPTLIKNKNASVINVSSGLAFAPKQSAPVYCGTKAGVHIFTKALRYQFEDSDLKIFEIIPPLVETDMTEGRGKGKITPEELADEFIRAFEKNKFEVNIGKIKFLRLLQRILPKTADNILKKS